MEGAANSCKQMRDYFNKNAFQPFLRLIKYIPFKKNTNATLANNKFSNRTHFVTDRIIKLNHDINFVPNVWF